MVAATNTLTPSDHGLGPESHDRYLSDGVIIVRSVFDASEITHIRKVFTDQVESPTNTISLFDKHIAKDDILARYPRFVQPHRRLDTEAGQIARKTIMTERLLDIVTNLIGPAYGAQSMFYFKPPTARGQAFHQDNFFLRAHPETCMAGWIAVDDADAETGGLMVIPGSHAGNMIICPQDADPTVSFSTRTVPLPKGLPQIQTNLKAGDVMFFHGSLVHGSNPNTTTDRFRRSLIFHWIPQSSVEVAEFYQPVIAPDGEEVEMGKADGGGACGEAWTEEK